MEMLSLKASARDRAANPGALRRNNQVPCVVYGFEVKDLMVKCDERELHKTFAKAGESTLVELDVDGKKIPVLFKAVDFHPVTEREVHVDFYAVNMKAEIETMVPVEFSGEAPAVKTLQGVFIAVHDHVRVRCLPGDLPHAVVVDVTGMEEFHSTVTVAGLKLPKGVKVMEEPSTVLAIVQEPRKEEEIVVAAAAVPAEGEAGAAVAGAPGAPAAEAGKEGAPVAAAAPAGKDKGKK